MRYSLIPSSAARNAVASWGVGTRSYYNDEERQRFGTVAALSEHQFTPSETVFRGGPSRGIHGRHQESSSGPRSSGVCAAGANVTLRAGVHSGRRHAGSAKYRLGSRNGFVSLALDILVNP
jgi:hypothetical protein